MKDILKFELYSRNIHAGERPKPWDETEQKVTLTSRGEVCILRQSYDGSVIEETESAISTVHAAMALEMAPTGNEPTGLGTGSWQLAVEHGDGTVLNVSGSLADDAGRSYLMRKLLGRKDLFLFDGDHKAK